MSVNTYVLAIRITLNTLNDSCNASEMGFRTRENQVALSEFGLDRKVLDGIELGADDIP